jgi:hypothetical protein
MTGVPHRECEKLRERLPEYADGSLAGPARARVERHLGRCPRCAAEVDDLRTVLRAVHSVAPDEVPEDLLRRVRQAVRERAPAPAGLPRLWPRIAVPVAAAVAVVAVTFALRAPRESLRMAAAPQRAMARGEHPSARGGARGGAARGGGGAGRAARRSVVIAEATEDARHDRSEHLGGPNLGPKESAAPRDQVGLPAGEPAEKHRLLYSEADRTDATALHAAPGPSGAPRPPATPEEPSPQSLEREGTAGGGLGGLGGGGSGRGAGLRGGDRAGVLPAEKSATHQGSARRGGPRGDQVARGPLERRIGADREDALAAASELEEVVPTPSLSAALGFAQYEGRPALTLQLASDKPAAEVSVYFGDAADRRLVWQGSSPPTAPLLLTAEHIGPAAAATPVTIEAGEERRDYRLFTPTLARLGEAAASAPSGPYSGESVAQALAELTALTGLAVLAEEPLSQVLDGDRPGGSPDAALQEIAARAGLEVERAGDLVFNLKHPR